MTETKKLKAEDLQMIRDFRQEYSDIVGSFGQIEVTIISLQKQKEILTEKLESLAKREDEITSELEAKYGVGELNIETGEFIPQSE